MRVAVLDLGTNTFNLVIAENTSDKVSFLLSRKIPVKLGEGRINQGEIIPVAFQRGLDAIMEHYAAIQEYQVDKVRAFGTSALRSATNGKQFRDIILEKTGISIEIISGDEEATLIYYGVRETISMKDGKYLILDIGGGSNEFIIADANQVYWQKSYNLGIARLLAMFNPSDPITFEEINEVTDYLDAQTHDLLEQVKKHGVHRLIGASGSFETFVAMIHAEDRVTEASIAPLSLPISQKQFEELYEKLIHSTLEQRKEMKGLEFMRIEMIVLATLFVKFIVQKLGVTQIFQSNFSLKEGAVYQLTKS